MNLTLTPLDWLVCLDTLGGSVVLGLAMAARLNSGESSANFFLAGRQLTWPVIGRLTVCHQHRGRTPGRSFRRRLPFSAGAVELTTVLYLGIGAAWLYPYYIRNRVASRGDSAVTVDLQSRRLEKVFPTQSSTLPNPGQRRSVDDYPG